MKTERNIHFFIRRLGLHQISTNKDALIALCSFE